MSTLTVKQLRKLLKDMPGDQIVTEVQDTGEIIDINNPLYDNYIVANYAWHRNSQGSEPKHYLVILKPPAFVVTYMSQYDQWKQPFNEDELEDFINTLAEDRQYTLVAIEPIG